MWSQIYEPNRTVIGKFSHNDDLIEVLNKFCDENNIKVGWISIIGAVREAKLGYYEQEKQEYSYIEPKGPNGEKTFEIANATGNISIKEGKPFVHLHITVTDKDGRAYGGHVMPGTIVFAGEFLIQAFNGQDLIRVKDDKTGLPLWQS
ncbi:MAG: hypothetical protein A2287_09860 [Candidatus Melainabacteria bacterium RIFOXYA12_FULL_32_12]|nr:MAG: hypothetical protein A2255_03630 [Candidatus Melainabacteria bacterium RIFOXYA2_FULL_32_9]OGI28110.1 MAG: hypothetical protein A2287_09860 [Candidatus Melainabacteria bacterium RIFOXYA12_FULL_32_12]